ncbi:P2Y purinoceptor 8, partial [Biomphalaria pfeifferi]
LGSNIVSITVFIRQGMHSSMNISFVVLSLVDFIKCLFIICVSLSVLNVVFGFYFPVFDVYSVISAWPIGMIERIGLFITVFVTIERYLSVAAPLNVKKMITSRRALAILIAIIVLHVLTIIPLYLSVTLGWRFYPGIKCLSVQCVLQKQQAGNGRGRVHHVRHLPIHQHMPHPSLQLPSYSAAKAPVQLEAQ